MVYLVYRSAVTLFSQLPHCAVVNIRHCVISQWLVGQFLEIRKKTRYKPYCPEKRSHKRLRFLLFSYQSGEYWRNLSCLLVLYYF